MPRTAGTRRTALIPADTGYVTDRVMPCARKERAYKNAGLKGDNEDKIMMRAFNEAQEEATRLVV